jgi:hypothetical protein
MKTNIHPQQSSLRFRNEPTMNIRPTIITILAVFAALWVMPGAAHGQIYVTNYASGADGTGTVGEYDATTGATINASLVSGLFGPTGVAVSGGKLYVTNFGGGTIGEYDATTGATINASLVSGLNGPNAIVVSGGNLWVSNYYTGTIGLYDASTGATINASLVSGLTIPQRFVLSGGNLFVVNNNGSAGGVVGVYNATTGATVNASLVPGLNDPVALAVSEGNLFVDGYYSNGTISEYDATTGAVVNASLVSGFGLGYDMALSGGHFYLPTYDGGTIGQYDATTGATINASLVSGLDHPFGIAVLSSVCPQPQGHWKNNPGAWPVTSLTLGSQTYSQTELLKILKTATGTGPKADASLILADQLIAAKLNIANGSDDPAPLPSTITHADSLLSGYSGKLPYKVKTSSTNGQAMVNDASVLNNYNNAALTPGCTQ